MATGPYYWTQTLKWVDAGGIARARWHRLDLADNAPFSSWDAGDGDGPQAWRYQEFDCPGFDSGMVSAEVRIGCAYSPATMALAQQAEAEGWLIDVVQYQVVLAGLVRVGSALLGSLTCSGGLIGLAISGTCSSPPVAVSVPPVILTHELVGNTCVLDFS